MMAIVNKKELKMALLIQLELVWLTYRKSAAAKATMRREVIAAS